MTKRRRNHLEAFDMSFYFLITVILYGIDFTFSPSADIYISCVSNTNMASPKGWFIAMVSTTVETTSPETEILPGLQLLGPITEKCVSPVAPYFTHQKKYRCNPVPMFFVRS